MKLNIVKYCSNCGNEINCKLKKGVTPPRVDLSNFIEGEVVAIKPDDIQLPEGWIDGYYEHDIIDEGKKLLRTGSGCLCPDCVKSLNARQISEQEFTKRLVGAI